MSEPSGISIVVDGEQTDLADVTWLEVAPCGCASGCTVAYLPPPYAHIKVTADQAADDYYENARIRKQAEKRGFTIRAILRERLSDYMNTDCLHIPKWGVERPIPEGMKWAADRWGRGSKVLHLVDADAVDAEKGSTHAKALCSGRDSYGWSWEFARFDHPDCEKCIAKASEQGVLV